MTGLQISAIILAVVFGFFNFFLAGSVAGTVTEEKRTVQDRMKRLFKNKTNQKAKSKRKESILARATGEVMR